MRALGARKSVLLAVCAAMLAVVFPGAQPASAGGATFTDRQDDVAYYSWTEDQVYFDLDWDEVDIASVDVTTTTDKVQVSTRVVDLVSGWWDEAEVSLDVTNDGSEDFRLAVLPNGAWQIRKVYGFDDPGTAFSCGGAGVSVDYSANRITTLIPRSCIANTAGVAVSVALYDDDDASCCNDWVLDVYPDSPTAFSSRVLYDTAPKPSYDANGPMGTIYRLYRAYFLREPDKQGYEYWLSVYRSGYPLDKISNDFARSKEFQARYGSLDNAAFLTRVYQNVLQRNPDKPGYDYWMDQMARGMLRGYVMIYFSDSSEFRSKTAAGRPPGY